MSEINLLCPVCGKPLTVESTKFDQVFMEAGDGYTYIGSTSVETEKVVCLNPNCQHVLQRKETVQLAPVAGQPAVINTGGGAFIGGNVNTSGGDLVGRDKIVHATVTTRRG